MEKVKVFASPVSDREKEHKYEKVWKVFPDMKSAKDYLRANDWFAWPSFTTGRIAYDLYIK